MLAFLTAISCCQLLGELAVASLGLPVPGPVAGMAFLFCALLLRGSIPPDLGATADALIGNLALLFIPAGVGVMLHANLIAADWLAISVGLVISTALAIAVTALTMAWLAPRAASPAARRHGDTAP